MADLETEVELLKSKVSDMEKLHVRLDDAIGKISEVSNCINRMLAVHEEKIARQEQIDDIIFDKLKERASEIDNVHRELTEEIRQTEKRLLIEIKSIKLDIGARVGTLEKYKWLIIGGAIVIGWVFSRNFQAIIDMMS